MLTNIIYENKKGKVSNFRRILGQGSTVWLSRFYFVLLIILPLVAICLHEFWNSNLVKPINIVLAVLFFVFLFMFCINYYKVKPYTFESRVEAKTPDKLGLIYCILSFNWILFIIMYTRMDKEIRRLLPKLENSLGTPKKTKQKKIKKAVKKPAETDKEK